MRLKDEKQYSTNHGGSKAQRAFRVRCGLRGSKPTFLNKSGKFWGKGKGLY